MFISDILSVAAHLNTSSCRYHEAKDSKTFSGEQFAITTANIGMLPHTIHSAQETIRWFGSLIREQDDFLSSPTARAKEVASRLAQENHIVPIICCQEAFDSSAVKVLVEQLTEAGYSVISEVGTNSKPLSSGLLFASRFPINKDEIKFWQFEKLSGVDAVTSKGLLRVSLKVTLGEGRGG